MRYELVIDSSATRGRCVASGQLLALRESTRIVPDASDLDRLVSLDGVV